MTYRYYICDVFTETRFGGNQLAVIPEATGLSDVLMQQIAREFNFSESAFVFPPEQGHTRKVRIFTPTIEVPFAGHPNIGTAFTLAATGDLGPFEGKINITFEEAAGLVPITIEKTSRGYIRCELMAPEPLTVGKTVDPEFVAPILSLLPDDIVTTTHPPQVASVGLPFLMVELQNITSLERVKVRMDLLDKLIAQDIVPDLHLYIRSDDDYDIRARMFAPLDNVAEDPATGSANAALSALLTHYDTTKDGQFSWRIAQGVEMGRPSLLEARTIKQNCVVTSVFIGGISVMVSEGTINTGD